MNAKTAYVKSDDILWDSENVATREEHWTKRGKNQGNR